MERNSLLKETSNEEILHDEQPEKLLVEDTNDACNEGRKGKGRSEDAFNFETLVQHLKKAEGSADNDGIEIADREQEGKTYIEQQREILVAQATERVKQSDMSASSLTFEQYMTAYDKPSAIVEGSAISGEEIYEAGSDMTKNIGQASMVKDKDYVVAKNKTLKDTMKETNVIVVESDSDDSESSEDEEKNPETVSEKGDGHLQCHMVKDVVKATLLKSSLKNIFEDEEENIETYVKDRQTNKEINEIDADNSGNKGASSTNLNMDEDLDEIEKLQDTTEVTNVEIDLQKSDCSNIDMSSKVDVTENLDGLEPTDISNERNLFMQNEELRKMTQVDDGDFKEEFSDTNKDLSVDSEVNIKEKLEAIDIEINNIGEFNESSRGTHVDVEEAAILKKGLELNNIEETDESCSDDEEKPYYMRLDKSEKIKMEKIDHDIHLVDTVKSKEELKEVLTGNCPKKSEEDEDNSYREILEWKIKVPDQNVQILLPIERKRTDEHFRDELCEMLSQTTKVDKPEFEITPPKEVADENDKIMYASQKQQNAACMKYRSMLTLRGKAAEVKPPLVHKVLKLSQNYPVFQKNTDEIIRNEVKVEETVTENSLLVCNKISEVRHQMAEFNKTLEEFNERSRLAREEVIKDYNSAVEKELKIVEKLMKMKENMFDKRYTKYSYEAMKKRKPGHIDDEVLRKNFEDMDMILEEESDPEEEMIATLEEIKQEYMKELRSAECQIDSEEEYVLSEGSAVEEEREEKGSESYEQSLAADIKKEEEHISSKETHNESCEEYFTTDEEDTEEYYETSHETVKDCWKEPITYQEFIGRQDDGDKEGEEKYDSNEKETLASRYEEKEMDDKAHDDAEDSERNEKPVVRRTVTCSLEMQLAKTSNEDD